MRKKAKKEAQPLPEELRKAKETLEKTLKEARRVETAKQKYRRAVESTVRDLRVFGFHCSCCVSKELKRVFDVTAESPFMDPKKDAGMFVKVCVDSVTKDAIKEIAEFKTPKKKALWIRITGGKAPAVFLWEGKDLVWELPEAPLSMFIKKPGKPAAAQKGEGVSQPGEGKVKGLKDSSAAGE